MSGSYTQPFGCDITRLKPLEPPRELRTDGVGLACLVERLDQRPLAVRDERGRAPLATLDPAVLVAPIPPPTEVLRQRAGLTVSQRDEGEPVVGALVLYADISRLGHPRGHIR